MSMCGSLNLNLAIATVIILATAAPRMGSEAEAEAEAAPQGAWDWIPVAPHMSEAQWQSHVLPLASLVDSTYTYPAAVQPVQGWALSERVGALNADRAGQKGQTYFNARANAVAIALRGAMDDADDCAVLMLLCGVDYAALPTVCGAFSRPTLDYWSQATAYTRRVTAAYPGSAVALVGHSLGAAVAIGAAAQLSLEEDDEGVGVRVSVSAVGFSSPGSAFGLQKRLGLNATALDGALRRRAMSVVNEWDVLVQAGRDFWVGPVCLYGGPQPSSCAQCVAQFPATASSVCSSIGEDVGPPKGVCGECISHSHGMDVIQTLIRSGRGRRRCCWLFGVHVTAEAEAEAQAETETEAEAAKAVAAQ